MKTDFQNLDHRGSQQSVGHGKPRLLGLVGFTIAFYHFYRHCTDTASVLSFHHMALKQTYPRTNRHMSTPPHTRQSFQDAHMCYLQHYIPVKQSFSLVFVCEYEVIREYRTDVCSLWHRCVPYHLIDEKKRSSCRIIALSQTPVKKKITTYAEQNMSRSGEKQGENMCVREKKKRSLVFHYIGSCSTRIYSLQSALILWSSVPLLRRPIPL